MRLCLREPLKGRNPFPLTGFTSGLYPVPHCTCVRLSQPVNNE